MMLSGTVKRRTFVAIIPSHTNSITAHIMVLSDWSPRGMFAEVGPQMMESSAANYDEMELYRCRSLTIE